MSPRSRHVTAEAATMPTDLGLFLDRTKRMHPSICAVVSEVAYEAFWRNGRASGSNGVIRVHMTSTLHGACLGPQSDPSR
jgi:uncharacterized protein